MSTSKSLAAKKAWETQCRAITKPATEWLVASDDGESMHFLSDASSQKDLK
jgi:hypothetical protein